MDSLSHGLIGIAVAGLSGQPFSFHDPIYLAAMLGAQAPDFDIIAQVKGNFSYLRQHRAFSHSLPGIALWSLLISLGLFIFAPQANLLSLLGWAFSGSLSHIIVDYFNTHGAAILWPFCKQRKSLQLLNVFDPLLSLLLLSVYTLNLPMSMVSWISFALLISYGFFRLLLRQQASKQLRQLFLQKAILKSTVMPSLKRVLSWDFVLETETSYFVGQLGFFSPTLKIHAELAKPNYISDFALLAKKTILGSFFTTFTPFMYIEEQKNMHYISVAIYDLRYILNEQFLHRATIIFDHNRIPVRSYLHSCGNTMKIPCGSS